MRKVICSILCITMLSGCVATAMVAGASSIAGSVVYDKRSISKIRQDAIIEREFYNIIDQQDEFENASISIKSINNNALLVGYVENEHQKDLALNVLKTIKNVKKSYNQIRVGKPESALDEANDIWLSGRVKAALLQKKGLHYSQISAMVRGGNVYLMGIVPNEKQAIATDIARSITGVKKVITLFENP